MVERINIFEPNYSCVEVEDFLNLKEFEKLHVLSSSLIESPLQEATSNFSLILTKFNSSTSKNLKGMFAS